MADTAPGQLTQRACPHRKTEAHHPRPTSRQEPGPVRCAGTRLPPEASSRSRRTRWMAPQNPEDRSDRQTRTGAELEPSQLRPGRSRRHRPHRSLVGTGSLRKASGGGEEQQRADDARRRAMDKLGRSAKQPWGPHRASRTPTQLTRAATAASTNTANRTHAHARRTYQQCKHLYSRSTSGPPSRRSARRHMDGRHHSRPHPPSHCTDRLRTRRAARPRTHARARTHAGLYGELRCHQTASCRSLSTLCAAGRCRLDRTCSQSRPRAPCRCRTAPGWARLTPVGKRILPHTQRRQHTRAQRDSAPHPAHTGQPTTGAARARVRHQHEEHQQHRAANLAPRRNNLRKPHQHNRSARGGCGTTHSPASHSPEHALDGSASTPPKRPAGHGVHKVWPTSA